VVMVTHDPAAASCSQRVVFLADGQVVDALDHPTPSAVLDRMRSLGEPEGHAGEQSEPGAVGAWPAGE